MTIMLESDLDEGDAETVLYLREGAGVRSGEHIESNEGESEHNSAAPASNGAWTPEPTPSRPPPTTPAKPGNSR